MMKRSGMSACELKRGRHRKKVAAGLCSSYSIIVSGEK